MWCPATQTERGAMRDSITHLLRRTGGLTRLGLSRRRRRATGVVAVALIVAALVSVFAAQTTTASGSAPPAYLNPSLPVQQRVADLLKRMTLPEKIGQMVQIEATQVTDKGPACTSQG